VSRRTGWSSLRSVDHPVHGLPIAAQPHQKNLKRILIPLTSGLLTLTSFGAASQKPNIIVLFTDDQSYLALGVAGNQEIHTPNLDKLAQEGVYFGRHYNTTAICMASRACTMTGLLEYKAACNFQHGALSRKLFNQSYPVLLRKSGYYVGFGGKFGFPVTPEPSSHKKIKSAISSPSSKFTAAPLPTHSPLYPKIGNTSIGHLRKVR